MTHRTLLPSLALAAAWLPVTGHAQFDPGKAWINAGFYSYHYERHRDLEDFNPGIGIEWPLEERLSLTAGMFRNSDRENSRYVGVYLMPFELWGAKIGAAVGAFDGYPDMKNGGWFAAVVPTVAFEGRHWGLNVAIIPTMKDRLHGAISFQLKYRFSAPLKE